MAIFVVAIIMNEAALEYYGWENPLENTIGLFIDDNGNTRDYNVIGVLKDFNFNSLREKISPLVMVIGDSKGRRYNFKHGKHLERIHKRTAVLI